MPTGQLEMRLLVLGQAERGRLISLQIVAAIARVEVGRRRKLPRVLVGVAVHALLKLDLVQGVLPFRDVTLHAFQARMPALQRICAGGVLLDGKR